MTVSRTGIRRRFCHSTFRDLRPEGGVGSSDRIWGKNWEEKESAMMGRTYEVSRGARRTDGGRVRQAQKPISSACSNQKKEIKSRRKTGDEERLARKSRWSIVKKIGKLLKVR